MHQTELEAAQFIEGEVAVITRIRTRTVVRIFRADTGQFVGQDLARHAQAVAIRFFHVIRVARLGVGQMGFPLDVMNEGEVLAC